MVVRLRAWWQRIKKPLEISAVTLFLVGLLVLIVLVILGYTYKLDWTGLTSGYSEVATIKTPQGATITTGQLPAKSLWDWLQLLIIPAVLAVGGYVFNLTVSRNERQAAKNRDKTERDIAGDNQQEAALQAYIDKMSDLLLDKKLRESADDNEVRNIARVRTLTVLPRLNGARKGSVLQFLHESGLINTDKPIIVMRGSNLSGTNLFGVYLGHANLSRANLKEADLNAVNLGETDLIEANLGEADLIGAYLGEAKLGYAILSGADLRGAILWEANLGGADLRGTNLRGAELDGANLTSAKVTQEQLDTAKSLKGATMPDGSIHP